MPQMSPMLWMWLYFYNITMMMLFMIILYYLINMNNFIKINNNNMKNYLYKNKW